MTDTPHPGPTPDAALSDAFEAYWRGLMGFKADSTYGELAGLGIEVVAAIYAVRSLATFVRTFDGKTLDIQACWEIGRRDADTLIALTHTEDHGLERED